MVNSASNSFTNPPATKRSALKREGTPLYRLARAGLSVPREARVITERVGLRPCRPEVRLEAETLPGGRVLWHNYGHGGAGVTLSWGCARELTAALTAG